MFCAALSVLALAACGSSGSSKGATDTTATTVGNTTTTETPTLPAATTTSTTVDPNAPTITVTPSTGLTDGQMVTVTGAKFKAGAKLSVTECLDKGDATGAADCDLKGEAATIKAADASGNYTASYKVLLHPGGPAVACSATQPCVVSLGELTADSPHPSVSITFAG